MPFGRARQWESSGVRDSARWTRTVRRQLSAHAPGSMGFSRLGIALLPFRSGRHSSHDGSGRPGSGGTEQSGRVDGIGNPKKPTPARRRVLDLLTATPALALADLTREAGCSASVVKGLVDKGLVEAKTVARAPLFERPDHDRSGRALTPGQRAIADDLVRAVQAAGHAVTLLDGVPGAGKTEVYLEAVAACLKAGGQALVRLPDIARSAQWLRRFEDRFGARPAQGHSDLTRTMRRETWRDIAAGEASVVVGARSALFYPTRTLALSWSTRKRPLLQAGRRRFL